MSGSAKAGTTAARPICELPVWQIDLALLDRHKSDVQALTVADQIAAENAATGGDANSPPSTACLGLAENFVSKQRADRFAPAGFHLGVH
jgi:hypothetical protein